MTQIQQSFQVPFTYNVIFTENMFSLENDIFINFLKNFGSTNFRKKILFLIDAGVAETNAYLPDAIKNYFANQESITLVSEILVFEGGEKVKNDPQVLDAILQAIDKHGIDRHSFVAAIGGGAFLDVTVYASAIAHRGVKHIRIPSTVCHKMIRVGVKNGVNFFGKKNFLGTFAPPIAGFNDANFLRTLSDRDWRSEAIKSSSH